MSCQQTVDDFLSFDTPETQELWKQVCLNARTVSNALVEKAQNNGIGTQLFAKALGRTMPKPILDLSNVFFII